MSSPFLSALWVAILRTQFPPSVFYGRRKNCLAIDLVRALLVQDF